MQIQTLKLVFFSPTGTTKTIIQSIARGIDLSTVELIDITKPDARKQLLQISDSDLLAIAVPVYIGRVPALLGEWLHSIIADRTPAVCIVVYGGRAYEDALRELKDILITRECVPIACAAYIGEHSFSSSETPIAEARPDTKDLNHAELFGRKINERLLDVSSIDHISEIIIPGNYPYRGNPKIWNVDFISVSDACTQCGLCAKACPVGAIHSEKSNLIEKKHCITCCACIKNCPQKARTMKAGPVKDAAMRLNKLCKERKEPVCFF